MRIDLAKGREDYFIRPTVKEMFNARGDPRQRANSINRLGRLAARDPNAVLWGVDCSSATVSNCWERHSISYELF